MFLGLVVDENCINVKAHEKMLDATYDSCGVFDEIDRVWYYLNEKGCYNGPTYDYHHLSQENLILKYFFSEYAYLNSSYTWTTDVDLATANEIKTAYVNSMKKWNDVYYYSYDENGKKTKNSIINIVEGTSNDYNIMIYPTNNALLEKEGYENNAALTGFFDTDYEIVENNTTIKHSHNNKWKMRVNIDYFHLNSPLNINIESLNIYKSRTGMHELGHVLGLDDVDGCCPTSSLFNHHNESIMGYGLGNDITTKKTYATYQDIAGISITRNFHTDDDHIWMKRVNDDNTIDLICSLCNGVKFNVILDSNQTTYNGKSLNTYKSCTHYNGTNYKMLHVASDKQRDFYKCQYCRYIETIDYNDKIYSLNYNSNIVISNENISNDMFIKLLNERQINYNFSISTASEIDITLYDSNFNKVDISITSNNNDNVKEFNKILPVGTYYLKADFTNDNSSNSINIVIQGESHTHSYELKYYNYKWHKLTCEYGDTTGDVSVHTILQSEIVNNRYAKCLGCKQRLDLNKDMALIGGMNSLATKMSKNGSYVLPSGIIVLVNEDLDAYLNNTLIFYNVGSSLATI